MWTAVQRAAFRAFRGKILADEAASAACRFARGKGAIMRFVQALAMVAGALAGWAVWRWLEPRAARPI